MANKNVFNGWNETRPRFRPTYRYDRNIFSDNGHRIYAEEKARVPSWCDRVLWKVHPGFSLEQLEYNCCDKVATSDHSPVYATFTLNARLQDTVFVPLGFALQPLQQVYPTKHAEIFFPKIDVVSLCGKEPNIYVKSLKVVLKKKNTHSILGTCWSLSSSRFGKRIH